MTNNKSEYLNNGAYGCVMRPSTSCNSINNTNNNDNISKLFKEKRDADEEKRIHDQIIKKIDPYGDFTTILYEGCNVPSFYFPRSELKKCKNFDAKYNNRLEIPQLVYQYGGIDLEMAPKKFGFKVIFYNIGNIFKGIISMNKRGFYHMDIKPGNIVINPKTKKTSLIDFGLSSSKKNVYTRSNTDILKHSYQYYPPEFYILHLYYIHGKNLQLEINKNKILYKNYIQIRDNILITGSITFKESNSKFVVKWNSLFHRDFEEFESFVQKSDNFERVIRKFKDRIDIYMLGVTILELVYSCCYNGTSKINAYNCKFYMQVLDLAQDMTFLTPSKRITPEKAYIRYLDIINSSKK
jgi:serine/threonine protein kinase